MKTKNTILDSPKFTHVRNIHFFEGPLTSEYTCENNETYIFHWANCNEDYNIWLVCDSSDAIIEKYLADESDLRSSLIEKGVFRIVYVDNMGEVVASDFRSYEQIEVYLPGENILYSSTSEIIG